MKKNYYEIISNLTDKYIPINLSDDFESNSSLFECSSCHNQFNMSIHGIMRRLSKKSKHFGNGVCPYCEISNKNVTENQARYKFDKAANGEYQLLQYSGKLRDKSLIKHISCGHTYSVSLITFINGGRRCPKCFGTPKYSLDEVRTLISNENNSYTLISNKYDGIDTKIKLKHETCGTEFDVTLHNYLHGSRCPHCWRELNRSHGETQIKKILSQNNIIYEEQKAFNDLKYKRLLKYDFYIPSLNLCIEYDGQQHFKYEDAFKIPYEKFVEQQKIDKLKTEYCKNKKINLLRIKYKLTNKKLATFLNDFLNGNINITNKDIIFYNDFENSSYFN